MLELRIKQGRRHVPIFDLPARVGRAEAAKELGDTIDGLIAFLDDLSGDPDIENATDVEDDFALSVTARHFASGPGCAIGDGGDQAWLEWNGPARRSEYQRTAGHEDDEEDDPSGQCDEDGINTAFDAVRFTNGASGPGCEISDPGGDCANEDQPGGWSQSHWDQGPGCPISDPGGCQHDGREHDDGY